MICISASLTTEPFMCKTDAREEGRASYFEDHWPSCENSQTNVEWVFCFHMKIAMCRVLLTHVEIEVHMWKQATNLHKK